MLNRDITEHGASIRIKPDPSITDSITSPDPASVAELDGSARGSCALRVERELSSHGDEPPVSLHFLTGRATVEPGDDSIEVESLRAVVHRVGYQISKSAGSRTERDREE